MKVQTKGISKEAKNATIERSEFDAVMNRLLQAKRPITKQEISSKVKREKASVSNAAKRSGQR